MSAALAIDPSYLPPSAANDNRAGRLKSANGFFPLFTYNYDNLNNLVDLGNMNGTRRIRYNSRNLVDALIGGDGSETRYRHDGRGNVTNRGDQGFRYDYTDQPVGLTGPISGSFRYDGHKRRVKSVMGAAGATPKTRYSVYDAAGRLVYIDEVTDNKQTTYMGALGRWERRGGAWAFIYTHSDHLGSIQSATKQDGSIDFIEFKTPNGRTISRDNKNDNQARYTGHIEDTELDMSYMQARFYDPAIRRFLSVDPVTFTGSGYNPDMFNRYVYAENNPVNRIDPDGRDSCNLRGCSDQINLVTGQGRLVNLDSIGAKSLSLLAGTSVAVIAAPVVNALAAACTGACPAIAVGAGAGTVFEGNNQRQAGEFNPVKLGLSAAVGASGGAGSLIGKTIGGQMAGAAGAAGLAGATVEMLDQAANNTVDGSGVAIAGLETAAGAAFGAGIGGALGKGLTASSAFGAAGSLSNGGAAFGAAVGEAASGTAIEVLDEE